MKSRPLTSVWTDVHLGLLVVASATAALGALTVAGETAFTVGSVGIVMATVALASVTDSFGGLVVGLLAGAATTALRHAVSAEQFIGFANHAATLILLMVVGASTGNVGERIRRGRRVAARLAANAVAPVEGTLGLISFEDAQWRLEEEKERAQLHDRPLSIAQVTVRITDTHLADDDRIRAIRAVARSLESELRPTDVPFVISEGNFGIILPESNGDTAADVIEPALIVGRQATFTDRVSGKRRRVCDVADVRVSVGSLRQGVVPVAVPAPAPMPLPMPLPVAVPVAAPVVAVFTAPAPGTAPKLVAAPPLPDEPAPLHRAADRLKAAG